MAVDVESIDPLLAKLNEVFAGTQLAREKLEAWTLLRDIADAYAVGDIAEHELRGYVTEIAEAVCAQVSSAGKAYPPERLADELIALVKQRAKAATGTRYTAMVERLRAAREKAREKRERLSLL